MLRLRRIGPHDYTVVEDRRPIGRIRWAEERVPSVWLWNVTVTIPGAPFGGAASINEAKSRFRAAWRKFKSTHGPEELAKAFAKIGWANRPDRYDR